MIEELKQASSANEMEKSSRSLTQHLSHEVKIGKRRLTEQMASLRKERERALEQVCDVTVGNQS